MRRILLVLTLVVSTDRAAAQLTPAEEVFHLKPLDIRRFCEDAWVGRGDMIVHCIRSERQAKTEVDHQPSDVRRDEYLSVRKECAVSNPSSYSSRAACMRVTYDAIRRSKVGRSTSGPLDGQQSDDTPEDVFDADGPGATAALIPSVHSLEECDCAFATYQEAKAAVEENDSSEKTTILLKRAGTTGRLCADRATVLEEEERRDACKTFSDPPTPEELRDDKHWAPLEAKFQSCVARDFPRRPENLCPPYSPDAQRERVEERKVRERESREREKRRLERAAAREAARRREEGLERRRQEEAAEANHRAAERRRQQEAKLAAERAASGWSKLQNGMSREQVLNVIGPPRSKEETVVMEVWVYAEHGALGCGTVHFDGGRVVAWREPWTCR